MIKTSPLFLIVPSFLMFDRYGRFEAEILTFFSFLMGMALIFFPSPPIPL